MDRFKRPLDLGGVTAAVPDDSDSELGWARDERLKRVAALCSKNRFICFSTKGKGHSGKETDRLIDTSNPGMDGWVGGVDKLYMGRGEVLTGRREGEIYTWCEKVAEKVDGDCAWTGSGFGDCGESSVRCQHLSHLASVTSLAISMKRPLKFV